MSSSRTASARCRVTSSPILSQSQPSSPSSSSSSNQRQTRRPCPLMRMSRLMLLTLMIAGCSMIPMVRGDPNPDPLALDTEFLTTSSTVTPVKLTTKSKSQPPATTVPSSTQHVLVSTVPASSSQQPTSTARSTTAVHAHPAGSSSSAATDKPSTKLDKKGEPFLTHHEFQQLKNHRDRIANATGGTKDSGDKEDKPKRPLLGGGSFGLGLLNPPLNPSLLQQHHLHQQHLLQQALNANSKGDSNETALREREALQEEGSYHQPVVFVGGPGYIPPNNLRPRPILEATDPLWQERPLVDTRYPVPLQAAWDRNYRNPFNMTRVQHIEAECQDDFMKIRVAFNGSFQGLIYSSGYSYDPDCVYINGTGRDYYEYLIRLNRCGTLGASNHVEGRKEPSKNFMWNTVTVQYNPMIEEEWDEHFKVTCEYGYDFWKTVTFPFLDVEVATGNPVVFTLTPPECYMEVRYGFGASGTRVGGPVRVGDPLTLMIYMRSQYDGFDIVVNDCYAHNGASKRIQLIDHYGCPVDSKLMSPFRGTWSHTTVYETQVYAYLKTFRFTGSPALYIECDVRMCHGQCPSQPCYWRNVKNVRKRSVDSNAIESNLNTTLSEKMNLFQALKVLQEDEEIASLKTETDNSDSVCLKTGVFTALFGLGTVLLTVVGMVSMITCVRLRRVKLLNDCNASDILRPYSTTPPIHHHHLTPHSQHQQRHWSNSAVTKSRVP